MKNILITSAGQRVSLVRDFQKEILILDANAKVYTVDINPILAPACHVSDGYKQVEPVTDEAYIVSLLDICEAWNIGMIVPTIDTELLILSENKEKFFSKGIHIIVSSTEFVAACRDKRIISSFFTEKGIEIPKPINKENPSFPLFIKPYDGSLSKDIFLINDESELTEYHLSHEKFMFMEYIDSEKHSEYTVDTYYNKKHKLCCVVPRKRIAVRSGEVNKGVTHKNEVLEYVKKKLDFIEGAIGCLTIQFFFNYETKRIIGIEINPRFGGGYPLSYLAGANFPKWLINEYFLEKQISYTENWKENLLMLRYDDEVLVKNYNE